MCLSPAPGSALTGGLWGPSFPAPPTASIESRTASAVSSPGPDPRRANQCTSQENLQELILALVKALYLDWFLDSFR